MTDRQLRQIKSFRQLVLAVPGFSENPQRAREGAIEHPVLDSTGSQPVDRVLVRGEFSTTLHIGTGIVAIEFDGSDPEKHRIIDEQVVQSGMVYIALENS